ncbi:MAG: PIN domain-containing protein [Betaproteobacteria bacterium]|nr:PIN domain-containing protein [Betaproteobacteria bacterium]
MAKRTYLDSGVLLAAFKGEGNKGKRAIEILDDPERELLVSEAVWLEVMPKPIYEKQQKEREFYETVFETSKRLTWSTPSLARAAHVAQQYGIAAMDAIHVAQALDACAEELITAEKPSKPIFRVQDIAVRSIQEEIA